MIMFLTGSRAYGTPREDSDIDICILDDTPDKEFANLLWRMKDEGHASCRFGKINFITTSDLETFSKWAEVTRQLIEKRPVSRSEAIQAFREAGVGLYPPETL